MGHCQTSLPPNAHFNSFLNKSILTKLLEQNYTAAITDQLQPKVWNEARTFFLRVPMKVICSNFYDIQKLHRNQICGENPALEDLPWWEVGKVQITSDLPTFSC